MNILHKKYKGIKPVHDWYLSSPQIEEAVVSPVSLLRATPQLLPVSNSSASSAPVTLRLRITPVR